MVFTINFFGAGKACKMFLQAVLEASRWVENLNYEEITSIVSELTNHSIINHLLTGMILQAHFDRNGSMTCTVGFTSSRPDYQGFGQKTGSLIPFRYFRTSSHGLENRNSCFQLGYTGHIPVFLFNPNFWLVNSPGFRESILVKGIVKFH